MRQAGDRSLVDLIAHEITHSWTGNLVTNSNFEHFWLNEGFTVFIERKIAGRLHGEATRNFSAIGGKKELAYAVCCNSFFNFTLIFLFLIIIAVYLLLTLYRHY